MHYFHAFSSRSFAIRFIQVTATTAAATKFITAPPELATDRILVDDLWRVLRFLSSHFAFIEKIYWFTVSEGAGEITALAIVEADEQFAILLNILRYAECPGMCWISSNVLNILKWAEYPQMCWISWSVLIIGWAEYPQMCCISANMLNIRGCAEYPEIKNM